MFSFSQRLNLVKKFILRIPRKSTKAHAGPSSKFTRATPEMRPCGWSLKLVRRKESGYNAQESTQGCRVRKGALCIRATVAAQNHHSGQHTMITMYAYAIFYIERGGIDCTSSKLAIGSRLNHCSPLMVKLCNRGFKLVIYSPSTPHFVNLQASGQRATAIY